MEFSRTSGILSWTPRAETFFRVWPRFDYVQSIIRLRQRSSLVMQTISESTGLVRQPFGNIPVVS
jgi:hypothetical protein